MDSLGEGYGLEDLQAVLSGKKTHTPRKKTVTQAEPPKVNLLVDIQAKLQAGKGAGYARWAKVFNLKQMAQTMNYLSENNLLEYAVLEEKAAAATAHHNELSAQIKAAEKRMAEIAGYAASHWSCVYQDRRLFNTSDQCDYLDCYRDEIESVRLYYLASSDYQDGDLDIWIDTIREYDTSGQTGENGVTDWKLPSEAQDFDKASFRAEDGYWIFENSDGSEQLKLPILSVRPVWNGKTAAAELTAEETDAYAAAQRQEILTKVGVVYDVSERAAQETYALLDLDGDGTADRITLRSRMAQALNTPDHSPLDQYVLRSTRRVARCGRHRIWGTASMPSARTADRYC